MSVWCPSSRLASASSRLATDLTLTLLAFLLNPAIGLSLLIQSNVCEFEPTLSSRCLPHSPELGLNVYDVRDEDGPLCYKKLR